MRSSMPSSYLGSRKRCAESNGRAGRVAATSRDAVAIKASGGRLRAPNALVAVAARVFIVR